MIGGIHSALSGLAAAGVQTANTANNVANLNSDGFKKGRVLQAEQRPQGVSTIVEKVETPGAYAIEDTSEGQALIEKSNVDLSEEMPQMMVNQHSYNANLKTLQVADDMTASLLDIKA
ncbi:flagellar basal body rod C-terminal domain-containing protein [Desulfogranum marinum]|uniref:flagellar basal body rod C-terminal domain-containing protein n=1 Tax=Desulfogranum marinum TaxID=453220 RepID=UPI0029C81238|nr:flagellar basal body rod C-terminal domain-containing protein [Desulfogranum marinum]